jgi:metallo-beta-lactamase family protein
MFQGKRKESIEKNRKMPFDPATLTNVILSHAHIDHSGRIPVLTKAGLSGRIVCTRPTADAARYLLLDSAYIQELDAKYLNYKVVRNFLFDQESKARKRKITNREAKEIKKLLKTGKHELNVARIVNLIRKHHLNEIEPLYTQDDVEDAVGSFDGNPYRHPITVGRKTTCTFYDAGHILGSAMSVIKAAGGGKQRTVCYSGDVGRFSKPILRDPTLEFPDEDRDVDLLIMESTYGNRVHEPVKELKGRLKKALNDTIERGGSVVIPSFAFGRTQDLLYALHELYDERSVPRVPVFVDSPLASKLTRVYGEHPEVYDQEAHKRFLSNGENPFCFKKIKFVSSVEKSMSLLEKTEPHVVIAGSGMCEGGRVVHHLRYKIHNPANTILVVGYMAQNTLGRRIVESAREYEERGRKGPPPEMKMYGKEYPLKARVVELDGFSAHADRDELLRFVEKSNLRIKKIALVHGEEEQSLALAATLKKAGRDVVVPRPGETVEIG